MQADDLIAWRPIAFGRSAIHIRWSAQAAAASSGSLQVARRNPGGRIRWGGQIESALLERVVFPNRVLQCERQNQIE